MVSTKIIRLFQGPKPHWKTFHEEVVKLETSQSKYRISLQVTTHHQKAQINYRKMMLTSPKSTQRNRARDLLLWMMTTLKTLKVIQELLEIPKVKQSFLGAKMVVKSDKWFNPKFLAKSEMYKLIDKVLIKHSYHKFLIAQEKVLKRVKWKITMVARKSAR